MAGDWIKMREDLADDPDVYRISRLTGLDRFSVIGRLYTFWAWAGKHSVDGRVDGGSSLDVDDIVCHAGFADAMKEVKWLEDGGDFLSIPKHERHNSESAKERSLKNARQARWRDKKDVMPSTEPSTSESTKASTREEKRREDITTTSKDARPPAPDGAHQESPFDRGIRFMQSKGLERERINRFLGNKRKLFGDDAVLVALDDAIASDVSAPIAFLVSAIDRASKPPGAVVALKTQPSPSMLHLQAMEQAKKAIGS